MRWLQVVLGLLQNVVCVSGSSHTTHVALAISNLRGNGTAPTEYGPRPMLDTLGGFYVDPNHYSGDTYAGTRMIADHPAHGTAEEITMVGSDDGRNFWTVNGRFTSVSKGELVLDLSTKGGPKSLSGKFDSEHGKPKIRWPDGNQWDRKYEPPLPANTPSGLAGEVGGFYTDPNHYMEGTFTGTRFVSCPSGGIVTLVGTDDGDHFWAVPGTYSGDSITVDFSSKGGPSDFGGTYKDGVISWADGNKWSRPGGSLPPAPKGNSVQLTTGLFCTTVLLAVHFWAASLA